MESGSKICYNCEHLQLELNEKETEIKALKLNIKKLLEFLHLCESKHEEYLNDEIKCIFEDFRKFEERNLSSSYLDDNEKTSVQNTEEIGHSKLGVDYVYDENYHMYYNISTGYYYDEKNGYMYEPQSCTYYKYNYEKQEYEKVSSEECTKTEQQSSDVCEAVVHHVNNLNLNDDSSPESETCNSKNSSEVPIFTETIQKNEQGECNFKICDESLEENDSHNSAKDWIPEEGSNMTVTDMVRQIVDEHNNISDYIYDESCQMYYSPSTGYYYIAERKLLYDPYTGTYYFYDSEKQTYEFYSQIDYNTTIEVKPNSNMSAIDTERLKSRKLYWKKKLEQSSQSIEAFDDNDSKSIKEMENENEDFSSPEDGEIFSSDDESSPQFCIIQSPVKATSPTNSDDLCPPSIRAIVENSENLKIGSLILITCFGGIIGRDRTSDICLPDICVSKIHAEIKYSSELKKYSIADLGSQNGTFVNDIRLSQSKEKSEYHILNHGDKLSFGSCKLLLHIHDGLETCDSCEPGQVLAEISSQKGKNVVFATKQEKEKLRREEVRKLKKKYGLQAVDFERNINSIVPEGYEDKAEIRRQTVGSDCPYEKTEEASVDCCMLESNKGFQMLKKMGWKEGQALGATESGMLEPIPLRPWTSKAGLGSSSDSPIFESNSDNRRTKKWVKARERYFQLSTGSDG